MIRIARPRSFNGELQRGRTWFLELIQRLAELLHTYYGRVSL
jgi:hypothetical protein